MLAFALAFVLLAEAMVVIAWARNWQVSWWEWHLSCSARSSSSPSLPEPSGTRSGSARSTSTRRSRARVRSASLADLAGYTRFTEQRTADEVAAMLNAYFEPIIPLAGAGAARCTRSSATS